MKYLVELDQADISEIIAKRFGATDVSFTISTPADGSSPPTASAVVSSDLPMMGAHLETKKLLDELELFFGNGADEVHWRKKIDMARRELR